MDRSSLAERMIGESASFLQMQERVSRVAPLDKPVLIIGERGTGKELIAARLHYLSRRWDQAFLKINCASFSESLLDSQLFGHESGAFTGATRQQKGCFERAHCGSLFLDEVATTSLTVQEKLLRVTEYGEIERLGGSAPLRVDVRLIAATNVDLPAHAQAGKFREDLLDRLAFDVITLPPLRERQEDIPILAEHFAIGMIKELGREYFPGFSRPAQRALADYPWPGNVRELKNVVERAVYHAEAPDEPIRHIVFDPFESPWRPRAAPCAPAPSPGSSGPAESPPAAAANGTDDFKERVREFEMGILREALRRCQFNQRRTAAQLGLSYDQLRGYLRKYDMLQGAGD